MKHHDCDICVIGGGSGGLSLAAGAAQMGANILLFEAGVMGGDCLNNGCVPSKALLAAAKAAHHASGAPSMGIMGTPPKIDFAALLEPEVEISPTDQAVHESGNKSSIGPEEPNEDAANEPAADGTANTAASVVAAEPTDVVGTSDQTADAESLASEKMANVSAVLKR